MIAIVVGGSEQVWSEVAQARVLCASVECEPVFYVCNDMIAAFPESAIGVTLHPHKLGKWLIARNANGFPSLKAIWAHKEYKGITNVTIEQDGSVGLCATQVALAQGHEKVLLCGVPMDKDAKHFVRQRPWDACEIFKDYWRKRIPVLKPRVRSFSGWTAQMLGRPSVTFLTAPF